MRITSALLSTFGQSRAFATLWTNGHCRHIADGKAAVNDEMDQSEVPANTAPSVTRVPLHGPVDIYDVMCAKVLFALCGSVFPHPLLLAQQLLGIEDQDFPEFQLVSRCTVQ